MAERASRLTATEHHRRSGRKLQILCECDCGNQRWIDAYKLKSCRTRSCGCLQKEIASKIRTTHGHSKKNSPEYKAWENMKIRCFNPRYKQWSGYGGRGITVCERWKNSFVAFLADVGEKPGDDYDLDRIDVNGNYEPSNIRWAQRSISQANKRKALFLTIDGRPLTCPEWTAVSGIPCHIIWARYVRLGWTARDSAFVPVKQRRKSMVGA